MSASACSYCGRPAACVCVCYFPLPLLCKKHSRTHSTDTHFPLPVNALRHVQGIQTQTELKERTTKLRRQLSLLSLYSDPQHQATLDIKDLLIQFYEGVIELKAKMKELMAESALREEVMGDWSLEDADDTLSTLIWSENIPDSELGTWMCIGCGLSLKERFQYAESCSMLEDRLKLMQSREGVEVLVLGLVLAEVMGLRIGRFREALTILEQSLKAADKVFPKSDLALNIANMKSVTLINILKSEECLDFCTKTVLTFRGASTSEVAFGTALYFYMTAYRLWRGSPVIEIETMMKEWIAGTKDISNSFIQHIRLYINAVLRTVTDQDYTAAIGLIESAEELARRDFPTSIYAGLCWYMKYHIKILVKGVKDDAVISGDECLRIYFPASLLNIAILESKAKEYHRMGERDKEIEVRLSIHRLQQVNSDCGHFKDNIDELETLYLKSGNNQAALDLLESVYRQLFEYSFVSPIYFSVQLSLSFLYRKLKMPKQEFDMFAETVRKLQALMPTERQLQNVLSTLANWRYVSQRGKATQLSLEVYQFLREKHPDSENYSTAVITLSCMYESLGQENDAAKILLEGIQNAMIFHKFKDYVEFTNSLLYLSLYRNEENKKLEVLAEAHSYLVSNARFVCLDTAWEIRGLFSSQPEKFLEIWLAVYHVLQDFPSSPLFKEYLSDLSDFCQGEYNKEKLIDIRLQVHRLLLNDVTSEDFFLNLNALADCYWDSDQRDKAFEFRLEAHRLLLPHPTSKNYSESLRALDTLCREIQKVDVVLGLFIEAYNLLQPDTNLECNWVVDLLCHLYIDTGNLEAATQIAQERGSRMVEPTSQCRENLKFLADLYVRTNQTEAAVDLYINIFQAWLDKRYYNWIFIVQSDFFDILKESEQRHSAIESFLDIVDYLKHVGQEVAYETTLHSLLDCCAKAKEDLKGINIKNKILQHVMSNHPYNSSTSQFLYRAGELYSEAGEKERAETCYCQDARIKISVWSTRRIRQAIRALYNGN